MILTFYIHGNQKDPTGNAIPYKRVLTGKFRKDSIDYMEWKEYVRSELDKSALVDGWPVNIKYTGESMPYPFFEALVKAQMHIKIYWKDKKHGDCDNVFKGIADAIFKDDKMLHAGSFTSEMSATKNGVVEVKLVLE